MVQEIRAPGRRQAEGGSDLPSATGAVVTHIVHVFPSFDAGGVQIRMSDIINRLGADYRHTVVPLDGKSGCHSRIDDGVDFSIGKSETTGLGLLGRSLDNRRRLRALGPGLLLTYNWGSIEWAFSQCLRPLCAHIHLESGFGPEEAENQIPRRALFRRIALARCHRLVVPSHSLVEIAKKVWKLPEHKVLRIPNGVDCARFLPVRQSIDRLGVLPGGAGPVIGTAAPLRREKNLPRLLRCFAKAASGSEAWLVIAGDGAERPGLEAMVSDLGIAGRVRFLGHRERIEEVLPCLDIYAMSSDTEQMPNSLVQAMACGLPVVATDVGDTREVLSEPNRDCVVAKDDEDSYAGALRLLLRDHSLRARLGGANRARAESHYSLDTMVGAYKALFVETLAESRR